MVITKSRKKLFNTLIIGVLSIFHLVVTAQIKGRIIDIKTQENLAGASITLTSNKLLGFTNEKGFFYIINPTNGVISFSMLGYSRLDTILSDKNIIHKIRLTPTNNTLDEVVVKSTAEHDFLNNVIKLDAKEIKKIPSLLGEKDVIKAIQILPGVHSIIEGGSGFSVNGGGADQNLVLVDNVPIYNFSHVFGLFSMFNTDAIKNIEFSKDGISARYGGRASSVLNIGLKDGNKTRWEGNASIGLTSAKATINGPIIKEKITVLGSFRRSYLDVFTMLIPKNERQSYIFDDYLLKVSSNLGKHTNLSVGIYNSNDKYLENNIQSVGTNLSYSYPLYFGWNNNISYLNLSRFRRNTFFQCTLYQSKYNYYYDEKTIFTSNNTKQVLFSINYQSKIKDIGINTNWESQISSKNKIYYGLGIINRVFQPQSIETQQNSTGIEQINNFVVKPSENFESFIFIEDEYKPNENILIKGGLRSIYWKNEKSNLFIEPRVSAIIGHGKFNTKLSFFEINQFVHLLSNVGGTLPTDTWITANKYAIPTKSRQLSLNTMHNFNVFQSKFYLEIGGYVKQLKNVIDYNNGENIISMTKGLSESNENLSNIIEVGNGFSSGFEVFMKGSFRKLDYWGSYTLSRTYHKYNKINFGDNLYPNFDRLHSLKLAGFYQLNTKYVISSLLTLASSNPISLPAGSFYSTSFVYPTQFSFNEERTLNNYRNNYRGGAYFRLDLSISSKKITKRFERLWEFNVFNSTFANNPIYYKLNVEQNSNKLRKLTSTKVGFIRIIPSISYTINF